MDQEQIKDLMAELGITLDNSPIDRRRMEALLNLIGAYAMYSGNPHDQDYLAEDIEEWLIG